MNFLLTLFIFIVFLSSSFLALSETPFSEVPLDEGNINGIDAAIQKDLDIQSRLLSDFKENTAFQRIQEYRSTPETFVNEVPKEYENYIIIDDIQDTVTSKSTLTIRGKNLLQTPLFINDNLQRIRGNGDFYTEYSLNKYGHNSVFITVLTPDNKYFTIEKQVFKLYSPSDIHLYDTNKDAYVQFFNSAYLNNSNFNKKLSDPFTRSDLAYFITQLNNENLEKKTITYDFSDVPSSLWSAPYIFYVTSNDIMAEYQDGLFRPNNQITKSEYLLTMTRALGITIPDTVPNLPYKDIDINHWSSKFVYAALKEGLISNAVNLYPQQGLTVANFIALAIRIPGVQEKITQVNSDSIVTTKEKNKYDFYTPIYATIKDQQIKMREAKKILVDSPSEYEVVFDNEITFKGRVYPPQTIKINNNKVQTNIIGEFQKTVPLEEGVNKFFIAANDSESEFHIHKLTSYKDLTDHWIKKPAAKLKYLNVISVGDIFEPKREVTRKEFIEWISQAMDWTVYDTFDIPKPIDISAEDPSLNIVMTSIQNKIMSTDKKNNFRPNDIITKAEAVTVLVRIIEPLFPDEIITNETFPFFDVTAKHWARNNVQKGLLFGIVSPSSNFFPKKPINRAELVSLISKLPSVSDKLTETFKE
jgi:hypothetical protein